MLIQRMLIIRIKTWVFKPCQCFSTHLQCDFYWFQTFKYESIRWQI